MFQNSQLPKTALLDYYTTAEEIIIFLIKKGLREPLVFRTTINKEGYRTSEYLNLCVQRLLIDFNGLVIDWKTSTFFLIWNVKQLMTVQNSNPKLSLNENLGS